MTTYSDQFKYMWWNHFITSLLTRKQAPGLADEDLAFLLSVPPEQFALVQKEMWNRFWWGGIIVHPRAQPEEMMRTAFAQYRNNSIIFWAHVTGILRKGSAKGSD